jgi:pyrroloquinoline-quinone synthase
MSLFSTRLISELSAFHLLKHPFYQAWNKGELSNSSLQTYAKQYFHHVEAFPRYISAAHSQCDDKVSRSKLLENLIDEERGQENHPELWIRFAEGLGCTREEISAEKANEKTQHLVDLYYKYSKSSYAEALGALFAYEHQVPEVSGNKIDGLQKFYSVNDERSLSFFKVHQTADVYHTQEVAEMIDKLSPEDQKKAHAAAIESAKALWGFMDGIPCH